MNLKKRLYIWLLDHHVLKVQPWEDPRRSPEDRAPLIPKVKPWDDPSRSAYDREQWRKAEPKGPKAEAV